MEEEWQEEVNQVDILEIASHKLVVRQISTLQHFYLKEMKCGVGLTHTLV